MTQQERLIYLIDYLKKENDDLKNIEVPDEETEQKRLLRSLMNIRPAKAIGKDFLDIQDAYLQAEQKKKRLISLADFVPVQKGIYLWQGDITALKTDGIVNAANSALLGCFVPCHGCIDNAVRCRNPASPGVRTYYGGTENAGACWKSKNNKSVQSPVPLCSAYSRTCYLWKSDRCGLRITGGLLPLLHGACRC